MFPESEEVPYVEKPWRLLASPICDAQRFARNLEETFRGMWRTWCEQQKPPKQQINP